MCVVCVAGWYGCLVVLLVFVKTIVLFFVYAVGFGGFM